MPSDVRRTSITISPAQAVEIFVDKSGGESSRSCSHPPEPRRCATGSRGDPRRCCYPRVVTEKDTPPNSTAAVAERRGALRRDTLPPCTAPPPPLLEKGGDLRNVAIANRPLLFTELRGRCYSIDVAGRHCRVDGRSRSWLPPVGSSRIDAVEIFVKKSGGKSSRSCSRPPEPRRCATGSRGDPRRCCYPRIVTEKDAPPNSTAAVAERRGALRRDTSPPCTAPPPPLLEKGGHLRNVAIANRPLLFTELRGSCYSIDVAGRHCRGNEGRRGDLRLLPSALVAAVTMVQGGRPESFLAATGWEFSYRREA
nr:hypothetical protein Iba_chr14dCG3200 [Ipomoea batatas]